MKPNWSDVIEQLKSSLAQLKRATPSLPPVTYQTQTYPASEIAVSLQRVIEALEYSQSVELDAVIHSVLSPNIINSTPALVTATTQYIAQGGVSPYADSLINQIWSITSSLAYLTPVSNLSHLYPLLSKESSTKFNELSRLNDRLEIVYKNIENHQKIVKKFQNEITTISNNVKAMADEASNAKTNAESYAVQAASSRDNSEKLKDEILLGTEGINLMSVELISLQNKAEEILGLANQGALAKSFQNRKDSLLIEQKQWVDYFRYGLLGLFLVTFISIAFADFLNMPPVVKNGAFDYWGVILRLLLASPLLWFTWFSVRQYGNNVTLIEDYAFKEASALAFVGYKKDMEDDIDMVKLLRESAIHNFASAPSRLISKSEASSPMHEVFEKAFKDKDFFERFMEIIKALKPEIHK